MKTKLFSKDFTLVIIGQIISLFGNAIIRFALPLYLLRETESPALFGIVSACSFIPMIALSFIGGVLADRLNKRNIMVILDFATAIVVIGVFILLGKVLLVPLILVGLILLNSISGTYQPTVQASIPALVSSDNILSAAAVVNQVGALASLLGPVIGGLLFASFGINSILIIGTFCFIISAVMEIFIRIPYKKRDNSDNMFAIVKSDFKESYHFVRYEYPVMLKIFMLCGLFNLLLSALIMVGLPIMVVDTLKLGDDLLGYAQGALALGGLCGGILTAVLNKKLSLYKLHFLLILTGICTAIVALPLLFSSNVMLQYIVVTAALFCIMILATIFTVQLMATLQLLAPSHLVGKIMALAMTVSMCAQPLGQAMYGILFDVFKAGIPFIFLIVAVLTVVIGIVSKNIFKEIIIPEELKQPVA